MGMKVTIISGDNTKTVRAISRHLNVDKVKEKKHRFVGLFSFCLFVLLFLLVSVVRFYLFRLFGGNTKTVRAISRYLNVDKVKQKIFVGSVCFRSFLCFSCSFFLFFLFLLFLLFLLASSFSCSFLFSFLFFLKRNRSLILLVSSKYVFIKKKEKDFSSYFLFRYLQRFYRMTKKIKLKNYKEKVILLQWLEME